MKTLAVITIAVLLGLAGLPAKADFTHLAVDHRDLVHLSFVRNAATAACAATFNVGAFKVVQSGGPLSPNEFQVPAGKELIITDITWQALPSPASTWLAGHSISARLNVHTAAGAFNGTVLRLPIVNAPAQDTSYQGGEVHLTAAFPVASRRYLCPFVSQIFESGSATSSIRYMEIFGYLIDKSK